VNEATSTSVRGPSFRASIFLADQPRQARLADRQIRVGIAWREDERFKGYPMVLRDFISFRAAWPLSLLSALVSLSLPL
jgi:hypothetical protein